jgi:hypothetical protein
MRELLTQIAENGYGFAPTSKKTDPVAEFISNNVGGLMQRRNATVIGFPYDV